jgi:hypothetical protein
MKRKDELVAVVHPASSQARRIELRLSFYAQLSWSW